MRVTSSNAGGLTGKKLGDYELRALLGAGGMAEVYRGYDTALGRELAVKVLPAALALDAGYVERFRDEARRVAALTHPNIVPVYQYGEEDGLLYLVMPVLKESLRERMDREGTLPPSDAAKLAVQVAAALDAAHTSGIVHRDVKPENILLNNEGKAHLTDFGIARELSFLKETGSNRTLAATGLPVGTPEYMAPEQLRAGDVDQRADIYALGAVLYELLTGVVPHEAPTPYEVAALVLTAPTMPPSQRNPEIWPELEAVVMTAVAKEAKDRYRDARSFAIALRRSVVHRDPNAPKFTMPAGLYTGGPGPLLPVPGSGPLVLQGPGGPLLLDPAMSPMSGPLGPMGPVTTAAPAVWSTDPGLREVRGLRPKPMGRRTAVIAALVVLAIVFVCGGSSLAVLSGLLGPTAATDLRLPIGNGLTGAGGTDTPSSAGTAIGGNTTGQATFPAGATETPTATATATSMPQPTATAVPPPPLTFSGNLVLSPAGGGVCKGTMTVTNNSANNISWTWTPSNRPSGLKSFSYSIPGKSSGTWPPQDSQLRPGQQDQVTAWANCSGGPWQLHLQDSAVGNQPFTMSIG
jgi:hypothetical protein